MQQIVYLMITLALGAAFAIGTTALGAFAINAGLRDGRDDLQRDALTLGISLLVVMVGFGYLGLAAPAAASLDGALQVLGAGFLIDAAATALAFLVTLAIHSSRAEAESQARASEARHRRWMETSDRRLETWLEASAARPAGEVVASTPPGPEDLPGPAR